MPRSKRCLTLVLLLCLPLAVAAREVGGIDVAEEITLAATPLTLNGAGIRDKFFFDIYVGALYLPQKTRDAAQAIAMPGPKRVLMHFLYNKVDREKLVDGWIEGFENNLTAQESRAVAERLAAFNKLFVTVTRGDRIDLDYLPGSGTRVSLNGEARGVIPGDDFFAALLKVWLGRKPADDDLKAAMLGGG